MTVKFRPFTHVAVVCALVLASVAILVAPRASDAAQLTQAYVRLDRMAAVTATTGKVCAKPTTVATEASVQVTFPTTTGISTDFAVSGTAGNWTVSTSNLDSGETAWPSIATATAVSGKTVTFPSGDLTVGTLYCFNWTGVSTLTTSSAYASTASEATHGSVVTRTSAPVNIDSGTFATYVISSDLIDISPNAVVPPSFSFILNGNTDSFSANLSTGAVTATGGRTATIVTNAPNGWIVWARDANDNGGGRGSLRSASAGNYNIGGSAAVGASRTLSTGTEDYGMGVTSSGGGSVNANYDGASSKAGTLDPTRFQQIASSTTTANNDVLTMIERATIAGQTPAGTDYTDTITVVGAGRF